MNAWLRGLESVVEVDLVCYVQRRGVERVQCELRWSERASMQRMACSDETMRCVSARRGVRFAHAWGVALRELPASYRFAIQLV